MKIRHLLAVATGVSLFGTAQATELVSNGGFSAGNSGFTSTYGPLGSPQGQGSIGITTNPASLCSCFVSIGDHTTGSGNMLFVDGADNNTGAFWTQSFTVLANSAYTLSIWASSLGTTGPQPVLRATINGANAIAATPLGYSTGNTATTWQQFTAAFNSGSATSVTLSLFDDAQVYAYNDMVVDDISFTGPAAVAAVPEPAAWAIMILGLGLVGGTARRRSSVMVFA